MQYNTVHFCCFFKNTSNDLAHIGCQFEITYEILYDVKDISTIAEIIVSSCKNAFKKDKDIEIDGHQTYAWVIENLSEQFSSSGGLKINGFSYTTFWVPQQAFPSTTGTISDVTYNGNSINDLCSYLPGMKQEVNAPCECVNIPRPWFLKHSIIHLNDMHKWSREKIADWLDELHDKGDIDIEFGSEPIEVKPIEKRKAEVHFSAEFTDEFSEWAEKAKKSFENLSIAASDATDAFSHWNSLGPYSTDNTSNVSNGEQ